jgi:hypothetical protein
MMVIIVYKTLLLLFKIALLLVFFEIHISITEIAAFTKQSLNSVCVTFIAFIQINIDA